MHKEPGVAPELQRYADDLRWAQALVLVYPTWWSGQPAMLKGWIDRVWVAGVAWDLPPGANVVRPLLRNVRRIVVITGPTGRRSSVNAHRGRGRQADGDAFDAGDVRSAGRARRGARSTASTPPATTRASASWRRSNGRCRNCDGGRQAECRYGFEKSTNSALLIIAMNSAKPSAASGGGGVFSPSLASASLVK